MGKSHERGPFHIPNHRIDQPVLTNGKPPLDDLATGFNECLKV